MTFKEWMTECCVDCDESYETLYYEYLQYCEEYEKGCV